MAIGLAANRGSIAIKEEVTEGTYVAEAAGADFIEVLADGLEFTPGRELLERNNRTSTVEVVASRVGQKSMTGSIPVEFKAGSTEGAAPETDPLWKGLLGARRQNTTDVTTKAVGNTDQILQIEDADISKFKVGDIVRVEQAGDHQVWPITAVDSTGGSANITLLAARAAGAYSASVVVSKFTTYYHDTGAPTLSVTNYLGGEIREKAIGMRVTSGELGNFTTGTLPDFTFALEGLTFDREVGTPLFTPAFDASLPPVTLKACVYKDGVSMDLNEFGVSMTNTIGFLTSTCSENGKISSRITKFAVTGSINPYMDDANVDNFDLFNDNTEFSLFAWSANPDSVAGEVKEIVAIYIPFCRVSELATGDQEGILTDAISFTANRSLGNDTVFVGFI